MRPLMKLDLPKAFPAWTPSTCVGVGREAARWEELGRHNRPVLVGPVDGGMFVVVARPPGAWWEGPFAGEGGALTE